MNNEKTLHIKNLLSGTDCFTLSILCFYSCSVKERVKLDPKYRRLARIMNKVLHKPKLLPKHNVQNNEQKREFKGDKKREDVTVTLILHYFNNIALQNLQMSLRFYVFGLKL